MIRIFVTGDNHIGKKYDGYPEIRTVLVQNRLDCLKDMVRHAEEEGCELFVVTGDLFDSVRTVSVQDVRTTAEILKHFDGNVLILPGNHDYYTGEEKVWKDFQNALGSGSNVLLLTEMRPVTLEAGGEELVIYPAYCQSKHSKENNLGWIRAISMPEEQFHIGIAHGAIQGITPDMNGEYFLMTERELNAIPVDAWLIGHTHIPFPKLAEDTDTEGYKIFNAGTHQQTDYHNNTEGYGFVLTLSRRDGKKTVAAHSRRSGKIRFYDLAVEVRPGEKLADAIDRVVGQLQDASVVRITISGTVPEEDYENRGEIYKAALSRFLTYEGPIDHELSELITEERIKAEFAEIGFAAELLCRLTEEPKEVQMAYALLKKYQD